MGITPPRGDRSGHALRVEYLMDIKAKQDQYCGKHAEHILTKEQ